MKIRSWVSGVVLGVVVLSSVGAAPVREPIAAASAPGGGGGPGALEIQPVDREITGVVARMMQTMHYERRPIDDALSERWLDNYLDALDWSRTIFLKSDLDEFEPLRTRLDDDLRAKPPRVDSAMVIYERYRERLRERAMFGATLLEKPLDLTNAERTVVDRHDANAPWPVTTAEANELWRQRAEEEVIGGLISGRDSEEVVRQRVRKRYDRLVRSVDEWEATDVLELWLSSFTRAYDPHSAWLKPMSNDDFDVDISNSVTGIGASLREEDDYTTVADVVPGGPASRDTRLRNGDRILLVGQGTDEPVDVVGLRLDKVVKMIRGAKGTEVVLHVEHKDGAREVIDLTRDQVILEETAAQGHVEEIDGHRVGVLDLPSFYIDPMGRRSGRRASEDCRRVLAEFVTQGVDGVVLDLRGNGGGSLGEAIDVTGLFIPTGPVVQVRHRNGRIEVMPDLDPSVAWSGPLSVLVDANSASASEIVAGALQDYGRAIVVGDRATHGKGTVQQLLEVTPELRERYDEPVGGVLKLTVQKFYRVSGGSTQTRGVEADVVLPSAWDGLEVHEGDQSYALPWDSIPPAPHVVTSTPEKVLPKLIAASEARRAKSDEFSKLAAVLADRAEMEAEVSVSLVLAERQAEYAERRARAGITDEDEDEDDGQLTDEQRKARDRELDYVLDEALEVMADYLEA